MAGRAWTSGLIAAVGLSSAAGAAPVNLVQFAGGPEQILQLSGPKAVAYDDADAPLFRGDRALIVKAAGEPSGRVFAWDVARNKVRLSPAGRAGVWVDCADARAMSIACGTSLRISSDGTLVIGAPKAAAKRGVEPPEPPPAGRIPDCPGDPRCP